MRKIYNFLKYLPIRLKKLELADEQIRLRSEELENSLHNFEEDSRDRYHSVSSQLLQIKKSHECVKQNKSNPPPKDMLQADDHFFDDYYKVFEDRFRGSEKDITIRLRQNYSKILKNRCRALGKGTTAIDIGSGRGEMLDLLRESGFDAVGVDLNYEMVELSRGKGHKAINDDAIKYLGSLNDSSIGAITGIHIVEHLTFETLFTLLSECRRVLMKGGFILFETPNPENVTVGAHSFWFDSSHLKPLPPLSLSYMADYVGFKNTKIIRMRPVTKNFSQKIVSDPVINEFIYKALLGPVDYAILAES